MLQVHGYTITSKILEGSSTVIYRATQAETGLSVVLKVSKGEYPTPRELATFRQECLLLRSLNIPGVVKTFGVQRYGNGLALILEDLPGQSLAALIRSQSPSLEVKLRIAIKIVEILQGIHSSGITHRDGKPAPVPSRNEDRRGWGKRREKRADDPASALGSQSLPCAF
jgi:serine/threonine protein kinase